MIGRLILRGLPGEFTENSIYTWFPLLTPEAMKVYLTNLGIAGRYSFSRPGNAPVVAVARDYNDANQILGSDRFRPSYGDKAARVISGEGYVMVINGYYSLLTIMTVSSWHRTTTRKANVISVRFYKYCRHRQTRPRRSLFTFTKEHANSLSQSHILSPMMGSSLWILFVMYYVMCRCTGPRRSWYVT
jgi:hypothetical protein